MMEKKFKAAFGTAAEGNLRKHQQYLPPVVEALAFTLEKGFAVSSPTLYSVGSDASSADYAGEKMEDENWGLMKDNQISF
ncbi:MAG: hypothetical protein IKN37_04725 [Bacteroidales bacterium]|nr:hypothetical protein [Bacteroidales bacterium]